MTELGSALRRARGACDISQEKAAKAIGVSQQTIARWEGGSAEPSLQAISDLSALYGRSIEDLLPPPTMGNTRTKQRSLLTALDRATSAQWGYFGVWWRGMWKPAWFPVSTWAAETFTSTCARRSWVVVPTLNNRILLINLKGHLRCQLVPSQAARADWQLPWDAHSGFDLAAYRELAELRHKLPMAGDCKPREARGLPTALNALVLGKLKPMQRTYDFIIERVVSTRIRMSDGQESAVQARGLGLWQAVRQAEADELSLIELGESSKGRRTFEAAAGISLLDIPAIRALECLQDTGHSSGT